MYVGGSHPAVPRIYTFAQESLLANREGLYETTGIKLGRLATCKARTIVLALMNTHS